MSWLNRLAASVEEAALAGWRRRKAALVTVLAIGLSLSFPAAAFLSLHWTGDFLERLAGEERVRVFVAPGLPEDLSTRLREELAALPEVLRVDAISREEARARFLLAYPELDAAVAALSSEDLQFSQSMELEVRGDLETLLALVERLSTLPGVDEVRHDARWAAELRALRLASVSAEWVVGCVAFLVAAFGIGNAVSLSAMGRKDELATMRLVGAPAFHLRAPFVVEGLVQGLCGGAVAALVLSGLSHSLATLLDSTLPGLFGPLSGESMAWLVVLPGAAGAVGALFAVELILRRHAGLES